MNPLEVQTRYNPNLPVQLQEWQQLRQQRGQDPCSWVGARAHIMALGGPDPGNIDLLPYVPGSRCGVTPGGVPAPGPSITPGQSPEWLMPVGLGLGVLTLILLFRR